MKKLWNYYKSPFSLLVFIFLGGMIGILFGENAVLLKPIGDLFLNLLFIILSPLVFFSITSSIANMNVIGRLGKILMSVMVIFCLTAIVSSIIGVVAILIVDPTKGIDISIFNNLIDSSFVYEEKNIHIVRSLIEAISINKFSDLFSKDNMLSLVIFSIVCGILVNLFNKKSQSVLNFINLGSNIMLKLLKVLMYLAPIGLCCYFASFIGEVGELGDQILSGYMKVFILYVVLTIFVYFIVFTIYAFISGNKQGIKVFWSNSINPTLTALATCSSVASIPINLEYTKKIGVPDDIAETVIPLGANIHKDGSVIGAVIKIAFLFGLFGKDIHSAQAIIGVILVSLLSGAIMGSIPGGGVMGEMMILSIYGFPPEVLPVIVVIGTIIDAPAAILNSSGNIVCSMMITRLVEGKDWINRVLIKE